jgi:hypothetical protein
MIKSAISLLTFAVLASLFAPFAGLPTAIAANTDRGHCVDVDENACGHAYESDGAFHGLISVRGGDGSVIAAGTHASGGGGSGCLDCVWTLVLACPNNGPDEHGGQVGCAGAAGGPQCEPDQTAYRLYLQTKTERKHLVDQVCLGGLDDVLPVGQRAAQAAATYMKDLRPPAADVRTQPARGILVQLPVYFIVHPPAPAPAAFGPPALTEKITISSASYQWNWGDHSQPTSTTSAGGPYPSGDVTHTYHQHGPVTATLTSTWTGSYTFTVGGHTLGPFPAAGTASRSQPVHLMLHEAHSHLISGR